MLPECDFEDQTNARLATAGRTSRGLLIMAARLQLLAEDLKKEVRGLLYSHGIAGSLIKPVQRDYAFELATIPRRKQWVLKVKYPANLAQLNPGISGERRCRDLAVDVQGCHNDKIANSR